MLNLPLKTDSLPTIYLKSPFLKLIKERKTRYIIQLDPDVVQFKASQIYVANGQQKVKIFITDVRRVLIDKLPTFILESLNFKSKTQLKLFLQELYKTRDISEVYIIELLVQ
jgi:hypothetical protein